MGLVLYPVEEHVHGPGLVGLDGVLCQPTTIELSTVIGVGGCGHCISSNAMCWITPSFILVKRVAASASEVANMTLANMPWCSEIAHWVDRLCHPSCPNKSAPQHHFFLVILTSMMHWNEFLKSFLIYET